jgi:hypothetical protein
MTADPAAVCTKNGIVVFGFWFGFCFGFGKGQNLQLLSRRNTHPYSIEVAVRNQPRHQA